MIEADRLHFIRWNQTKLCVGKYKHLSDVILRGEDHAMSTGKCIILQSSFVGSPRCLLENYHDAMAIAWIKGHLDLFLTFKCNLAWLELKWVCEIYCSTM